MLGKYDRIRGKRDQALFHCAGSWDIRHGGTLQRRNMNVPAPDRSSLWKRAAYSFTCRRSVINCDDARIRSPDASGALDSPQPPTKKR